MNRRDTVRDDWDPGSTCLMKREMAAVPAIRPRPQLLAGSGLMLAKLLQEFAETTPPTSKRGSIRFR